VNYSVDVPNLRWWMEIGDTEQFVAEAREGDLGQGPIVPGVEFTWSSSNPSVLSIDPQSGVAIAQSRGIATVEVCSGSCTAWDLTVINQIAGVAVTPDSVSLLPYDRFNLAAVLVDAEGQPIVDIDNPLYWGFFEQMTWTTGDPDVAVLGDPEYPEAPSLVVGVGAGTTQVTARYMDFSDIATVAVMLLDFTRVSAGGRHTCALTEAGEPYCWGNGFFQPDPEAWHWSPAFVPQGTDEPLNLVSLASGDWHVCSLAVGGAAYCWGGNSSGVLGTGDATQPTVPVPVAGNRQYTTIAAGDAHTCAIEVGGQLFCWGSNGYGQLGITSTETCGGVGKGGSSPSPCSRVPTAVAGYPTFTALAAGFRRTCGLVADGSAFCWGSADGSPDTVRVPGGHKFAALTSGHSLECGLTDAGEAYCWGYNGSGLGDGATTESDTPVLVAGGHAFAQISAGLEFSSTSGACGVTTAGELYCWGWGASFIGVAAPTPTRIGSTVTWVSVSVGGQHACGMATDGVAYCWGGNYHGAAGVPGERTVSEPERVVGQIEP
jgi:alpha-tubulin suppressor-like RCC1 family protein